jgi:hypothetical protein
MLEAAPEHLTDVRESLLWLLHAIVDEALLTEDGTMDVLFTKKVVSQIPALGMGVTLRMKHPRQAAKYTLNKSGMAGGMMAAA